MANTILISAVARNARHWTIVVATLVLWLFAAGETQAGAYVIDDFESGEPVYLIAHELNFDSTVQAGLPVFSGVREVSVSGSLGTASWGCAELASTPADDGMRFTGAGGAGVVWYRSQIDPYHGMDFDALAVADRFYVKLSEDPGPDVRLTFVLQDQHGAYVIGDLAPDGSGYLELPFAALEQNNHFHHVSGFGLQASFYGSTTKSVTITEFGITNVPEPASAVLLAVGGMAMMLWRRRQSGNWLRHKILAAKS